MPRTRPSARIALVVIAGLATALGAAALVLQGLRWAEGAASYERSAVTLVGASMVLTMGIMGLWLARRRHRS